MTNNEQKRVFARNLDRLVTRSGHTRQEVADALGFNYKTFSGWCNGLSMPTSGKIQLIADYFHVGKSALVDMPEEATPITVVTPEEMEMLQLYRRLTAYQRGLADAMLAALEKSEQ